MTMLPRCVLIERATEYDDLLVRHGTREAVQFFLDQRGLALQVVEARHRLQRGFRALVLGAIPSDWRRASIRREELDRFLFEDDDIIVVLGPDGLVANVAKYLREQPVIGLNPQPGVNPGVLVPHPPTAAPDLLHDVAAGRARLQSRTMVTARADDGQSLTALNEIFVGHASHQSARYRLTLGTTEERQSSSGLIVATGTGATGWAASLHLERHSSLVMPTP
jgi:NAD kinase